MTRNFYFAHPIEASFDPRMEAMEEVLHGRGYGIYWYIREKISFFTHNRCRLKALKPFATRYFTYPLMVWVITETGLFDVDGEYATPRKLACELGPDAQITVPKKLKPAPKTARKTVARNCKKTTKICKKTTKNKQNSSVSDENRAKNDEIPAKNNEFSSKNNENSTKNKQKSTKNDQKSAKNRQKRGKKAVLKTAKTANNEPFNHLSLAKSDIDSPYIIKEKKKEREKDYYCCCCKRRKRRKDDDNNNFAEFVMFRPIRTGIRGSPGLKKHREPGYGGKNRWVCKGIATGLPDKRLGFCPQTPRVLPANAIGFICKRHRFYMQTPRILPATSRKDAKPPKHFPNNS